MDKFELRSLKNEKRRLEKEILKIDKIIGKTNNTTTVGEGILEIVNSLKLEKVFGRKENHSLENKIELKVKYEKYEREVTCIATLNDRLLGNRVFVGKAKCSLDDDFDLATGMCIAENRVIQEVYKYINKLLG